MMNFATLVVKYTYLQHLDYWSTVVCRDFFHPPLLGMEWTTSYWQRNTPEPKLRALACWYQYLCIVTPYIW